MCGTTSEVHMTVDQCKLLCPRPIHVTQNHSAALGKMGLRVRQGATLFRRNGTPFSGSIKERAQALMDLFLDDHVRMISDVSGGDSGMLASSSLFMSDKALVDSAGEYVGHVLN
jgi:hypothetical protein